MDNDSVHGRRVEEGARQGRPVSKGRKKKGWFEKEEGVVERACKRVCFAVWGGRKMEWVRRRSRPRAAALEDGLQARHRRAFSFSAAFSLGTVNLFTSASVRDGALGGLGRRSSALAVPGSLSVPSKAAFGAAILRARLGRRRR